MQIGEELVKSAETTLERIKEIDMDFKDINESIKALAYEMQTYEESANEMVNTTKEVKNIVIEQSDLIKESSSSIEQVLSL
jgi:methyl-accepting chemotaxis protein